MTAARSTLINHTDYENSPQQAAGLAANEDQILRAAELVEIGSAINDHADILDNLEDEVGGLSTSVANLVENPVDISGKEDAGLAESMDAELRLSLQQDIGDKEDVGVAASLADALQLKIDALNELLESLDYRPRQIDVIDSDASFSVKNFIRNVHQLSVSLENNSVTATYDEGLPDGSIIQAGVSYSDEAYELLLIVGDGTVEKFRSNRGIVPENGIASISLEGHVTFIKSGLFWDQLFGSVGDMTAQDSGE